MSGRDRRGPPPGLTEEERRVWLSSQRRFVWEKGDIVIIRWGDGKKPEGDNGGESPGR